ncbi:hypothetical protein FEM48_Zijuj08G0012700 [Ziziphus jujuba var. spinosa]|uniref:Survival protein SurE-like phosphatase/nucleotidase domain-containing protein n=1 Tax=Ziziphus jujuba var. spinosa TaxID=714518 RepID=A0A978UW55_ZIZJJ|nr:hypothetical protein FEM48_Zijuj08G0012700 [Ziziphus jujuba var. spinosa]
MTTSLNNNFLPPGLISNLQQVLSSRNDDVEQRSSSLHHHHLADSTKISSSSSSCSTSLSSWSEGNKDSLSTKPVVLVTNAEGIESPGLTFLVEALVLDASLDVCVCAPQLDRSVCGHSVTVRETISVCSNEVSGAIAYEVSGNASVDPSGLRLSSIVGCIVLLVKACFGNQWNKQGIKFRTKHVRANAVEDLQKGVFPKSCLLNIEIPSFPLTNKGFKITKQSQWRSSLSWQAVTATKNSPASHYMSNQQSLGIKLAQLSRDASAAGAARRLNSQRKNVEIESVGIAGKLSSQLKFKKYFRLELLEKERENVDENLDIRAVEDGFVSVTPVTISPTVSSEIQNSVSNWIATHLSGTIKLPLPGII